MGRAPKQRVEDAARAVLTEGERVSSTGRCWAVQTRPRVPLLLLARRKYVMALTDRRVLVFNRRRGGPEAPDLVIGKRYETFTLERVKRRRPLVQVAVQSSSGNRLVFEFRRGERELAGELIARLTPPPRAAPSDPDTTPNEPAPAETATEPTPVDSAPAATPADAAPKADDDESAFWGSQ